MIILFSFISTTPEDTFKCVSLEPTLEKISDNSFVIFTYPKILTVPLISVETIGAWLFNI